MKKVILAVGCLLVGSTGFAQLQREEPEPVVTMQAKLATVQVLRENRQYHCRITADGAVFELKNIPTQPLLTGPGGVSGLTFRSSAHSSNREEVVRNGQTISRSILRGVADSPASVSVAFPGYPRIRVQANELIFERLN